MVHIDRVDDKHIVLSVRTVTIGDAVVLAARLSPTMAAGVVEYFEGGVVEGCPEGASRTTAQSTMSMLRNEILAAKNDYNKAGRGRASIDSKEAFFRWPLRDYRQRPKLRRTSQASRECGNAESVLGS